MLGVDQRLFGGRLSLKYVRHDGRDEFVREKGDLQAGGLFYNTLTNAGRSRHESWRATWERSWRRQFLSLNATWQETVTSNEDYDDTAAEDAASNRVWYQGSLIGRSDLPRGEYNRPLLVNLIYSVDLPVGCVFTNVARYRSGFQDIEATGEKRALPGGQREIDPLTGEEIVEAADVYEKVDFGAALVFDWKFSWQSPPSRGQGLRLDLEIRNVFDRRAAIGPQADRYEIGRQFWAGAEWRF